ncbi:hypothetical protein AAF712_007913 [Marasmius tenuissimus]|uniref:RecQ-mediated genome instability protein 1 n=1 Tax=Marasmius tenuissimus TaxID=585030 RepID=A0ABR2ZVI3_9AGAR
MPPPSEILQYIKANYPNPRVDPEWLQGCYDWVIDDKQLNPANQLDRIIEEVEAQLLSSDLRDSMIHGSGIPARIVNNDTQKSTLAGPILVQIESITDIGVSAYNLNKTRQLREERRAAGARVEGEADSEVEEEGPIPEYTRSMLRFEIGDGATTMRAMEYRKIPELKLGQTPLGYKLVISNAEVRRGIVFLTPENVALKGGEESDLESRQEGRFANSLRLRLGLPPDPELESEPPESPPAVMGVRSPLRDISPPPSPILPVDSHSHIEDEDQPRRRRIPAPSQSIPPSTTAAPPSTQPRRPPISTQSNGSLPTQGPIDIESDEEDENNSSWMADTRRRPVKPLPARGRLSEGSPSNVPAPDNKSQFKEDYAPTPTKPIMIEDDDDMFDDDLDAEFLAGIDEAEMKAMGEQFQSMGTPSGTPSKAVASRTSTSEPLEETHVETITIDDEEEDDKENVPVLSRNVRRRTLQHVPPEDVIELSDSD